MQKNIFQDPCNCVIACLLDRWQEKSLFLKLLVVDVVTSATFAIGKFKKIMIAEVGTGYCTESLSVK